MFSTNNFYDEWSKYQKNFFDSFSKFYQPKESFSNFFPGFDYIDPLSKLKDTGDVYKGLSDLFNGFYNTFFKKNESFDFNDFSNYYKEYQEKYIAQIKNNFGLGFLSSPDELFNKFANSFGISMFQDSLFKPINDYLKNFNIGGDKMFQFLTSNEELEKFLNSPPIGLTREFIETVKQVVKNYIEYIKQLKIFENDISEKGKESFEKFVKEISELIKNGENIEDFDKVFKKWVEINENIFQDYFRSKEFVTFLSEYTKVSAKLKHSLDEYTFTILKNTNIATKTELDRAYKDIYNLKKEIKELKKRLEKKEDK